jgi:hypothetical protein
LHHQLVLARLHGAGLPAPPALRHLLQLGLVVLVM